ncbi:MFS transporter [Rothia kristinae]|uniref:MFS transporter n=1 Tax=Rothia kristinae TaxID=37923 RepID=UPI000B0DC5B1|nr:MFS transporter [Rothia kristinae]
MSRVVGGGPAPGAGADAGAKADAAAGAGVEPVGRSGLRPGAGRALIASMIGTLVEWYDYALYGAAASLVIGPLFFGGLEGGQSVAAFATFAVGFVARPLGGVLIAHLGDRRGRKPAMLLTILIMGVSTVGIGLLPTYQSLGVWAVVLLILLRFTQGLGAGAELTGALTLVAEYTPPARRGFWTSLVLSMPAAGSAIAILSFLAVAGLGQEAFLGWGWRLPFLVSVVLFALAIWIRTRLEESPEYRAAMAARRQRRERLRTPLGEVLRTDWRGVVLGFMAVTGHNANNYIISIVSITVMTTYGGLERQQALTAVLLASILGVLLSPVAGLAADRFSAAKVMGFGAVAGALFAVPLFLGLTSGSWVASLGVLCVSYGVVLSCTSGPQGAFVANLFPTETRFAGTALARETSGALVAGFTPMIVAWLLQAADGAVGPAAGYMGVCFAVTAAAMVLARGRGDNPATPGARA